MNDDEPKSGERWREEMPFPPTSFEIIMSNSTYYTYIFCHFIRLMWHYLSILETTLIIKEISNINGYCYIISQVGWGWDEDIVYNITKTLLQRSNALYTLLSHWSNVHLNKIVKNK